MKTATQFKHRGVEISIDARGRFLAKVNGQDLSAPSLDAMKTKIDKTAPFEPFDAFIVTGWSPKELDHVRVIGIRKDAGRRGSVRWVTDRNRAFSQVYRTTPEALERARMYIKLCETHEAIVEQQEAAESAALEAIGNELSAKDYRS